MSSVLDASAGLFGETEVILVVDHRPEALADTAARLERRARATTVLAAASAAEALRTLAASPVDAVVLDDALPDAGALLSGLARHPSAPPLVVLTEAPDEARCAELLELGAADYLPRSADALALPFAVARAIRSARLEARVKDSEDQFRALIDASSDAIYILVQDQFLYVNQRFAELFDYDRRVLTAPGFDSRMLIDPRSRLLVEERVRRAREGKPLPSRYEFRGLRRDGRGFDVEVSVSYIRYRGEAAVLGILQDITARKAYESALLRKNHELSVLNAVAEAITQARDLGGILEGVVERLIELLEVDAAGISILDDTGERFASVHYRGASETFVREMRARSPSAGVIGLALRTGTLQVIEDIEGDTRLEHAPSAREGFRSAVALPLSTHERRGGVVTVFTRKRRTFAPEDVQLFVAVARQLAVAIENARLYRKAQQGIARLQALSEIARAIGTTLEVEGVFRIVGERLQALVPYRRIGLLILRPDGWRFSVRTIDHPAPGEALAVRLHEPLVVDERSSFVRILLGGEIVVLPPGELRLAHAFAPDPRWFSALVPIFADQAAMGVFVVSADPLPAMESESACGGMAPFQARDLDLLRDLAAHMAISLKNARVFQDLQGAYRELMDAKDRLVRSEKLQSLGEMAAGVAHDFNNVLSAILGRTQMLARQIEEPAHQRSLEVIERAALDAAGTVRRIQEFAKAKADAEFVDVHLNALVRDAVELCTTRVDELGVGIELQVQLGEVAPVRGNPAELREVLTNLIYNAIDAMPHGGRLAIRTGTDRAFGEHTPGDSGSLRPESRPWVEVEDTGIGMDEETQHRIFDPFFTTKGARGTGLGLSVSYGIVQRHRGEFTLRSRRGEGSVVRVLFPAAEPRTTVDTRDLTPLPEVIPNLGTADQLRILVIDDDVAVRDVLADILRSGEHRVETAASGEEGLALFDRDHFDVVLTDLGMPGMSGWEVAKGIKARRSATPVGLITGWGASLEDQNLAARGVDLVVAKPFRLDQVLASVKEAARLGARFGS